MIATQDQPQPTHPPPSGRNTDLSLTHADTYAVDLLRKLWDWYTAKASEEDLTFGFFEWLDHNATYLDIRRPKPCSPFSSEETPCIHRGNCMFYSQE